MYITQLLIGTELLSVADANDKYIKRDLDTLVASNVTIYFMDAGSNLRIKNGKLQIRNDQDQAWYSLGCMNIDGGIPNFYVKGDGES